MKTSGDTTMTLSPEYLRMKAEFAKAAPKSTVGFKQESPDVIAPVAPVTKKVRHVFIEATFPELKGGASRQTAHGEAAGNAAALSRAFKNLLKGVRGKRFTKMTTAIIITTKTVEVEK